MRRLKRSSRLPPPTPRRSSRPIPRSEYLAKLTLRRLDPQRAWYRPRPPTASTFRGGAERARCTTPNTPWLQDQEVPFQARAAPAQPPVHDDDPEESYPHPEDAHRGGPLQPQYGTQDHAPHWDNSVKEGGVRGVREIHARGEEHVRNTDA